VEHLWALEEFQSVQIRPIRSLGYTSATSIIEFLSKIPFKEMQTFFLLLLFLTLSVKKDELCQ
jgi:hypothetical protein